MNSLRVPKKTMAEKFGRHPSDQCWAFNYFIKHIYDGFHHLVINNLSWWGNIICMYHISSVDASEIFDVNENFISNHVSVKYTYI